MIETKSIIRITTAPPTAIPTVIPTHTYTYNVMYVRLYIVLQVWSLLTHPRQLSHPSVQRCDVGLKTVKFTKLGEKTPCRDVSYEICMVCDPSMVDPRFKFGGIPIKLKFGVEKHITGENPLLSMLLTPSPPIPLIRVHFLSLSFSSLPFSYVLPSILTSPPIFYFSRFPCSQLRYFCVFVPQRGQYISLKR